MAITLFCTHRHCVQSSMSPAFRCRHSNIASSVCMAATTNQHQNELTITTLQFKFKLKFRCYPYYIGVAIAYVVWYPLKTWRKVIGCPPAICCHCSRTAAIAQIAAAVATQLGTIL